jgi:hypothetical protein
MAVLGGSLGLIVVIINDISPYLPIIFQPGQSLQYAGTFLLDSVWVLVSGVLMLSTIYARLKGIRL